MNLLLIEDDDKTAAFVARGFRDAGFACTRAADGEEGLHLALEGSFDAVVADLMLPKLDGLAVIRRLRAAGRSVPVIVLSARDASTLNVAATYNLAYNALALVASGLGTAVCIDGVLPAVFSRDLVFRPFRPALESDVYLAWKRGVPLTPAATALLSLLRPSGGDGFVGSLDRWSVGPLFGVWGTWPAGVGGGLKEANG